jgi:biotin transport system substrate-specific component
MISVGLFVALMAVLSQISITLPLTPVPLTLSLFAVYLTASVLGLKLGVFVQIIYLLSGAAGLPVFAGFRGGFAHLAGPTGGYLLAYLFMAVLVGFSTDLMHTLKFFMRGSNKPSVAADSMERRARQPLALHIAAYALIYTAALAICYLFGSLWLSRFLNISFYESLLIGVVPYIPLDIVKIAACAIVVTPVKRGYQVFVRTAQRGGSR